MKIYYNINEIKHIPNAVVTIGTFDGVHLGHQAILKKMIADAKSIAGETVVVTFFPHPRQVLNIDVSNLRFINTQEQKIELLKNIGIDNLLVINFTREFSRTTSDDFIKHYIVDKIHPAKLIVGYDHHFGKNRMGDFDALYDMGIKYGFKVERVNVQDVENIAVSSTKIRNALRLGDVTRANNLLGYCYTLEGVVVHGNKIGRTIGFPTVNIDVKPEFHLIETPGVYACFIQVDGKQYKGMANIGIRPTVEQRDNFIFEVNIFDFDAEIYGSKVYVKLVKRIRDEKKHADLDSLKKQLTLDKETVKEMLNTEGQ